MSSNKTMHSKVSATGVASGAAGFIVLFAAKKLGVELDGWEPVLGALLLSAVTMLAGWLKREHVISTEIYDNFVGIPAETEAVPAITAGGVVSATRSEPLVCTDCPAADCVGCPAKVIEPDINGVPADVIADVRES